MNQPQARDGLAKDLAETPGDVSFVQHVEDLPRNPPHPRVERETGLPETATTPHDPAKDDTGESDRGQGGRFRVNWTAAEDRALCNAVAKFGAKNWERISAHVGGQRSSVQCLYRWRKYLEPSVVDVPWTEEEDSIVSTMVEAKVRWSVIASRLVRRTGRQCRERWLNHLSSQKKAAPAVNEEEDTSALCTRMNKEARWQDLPH